MHQATIILLIFLFGCGGEYNTSELVWEQKTKSTKSVLDKVPTKEWMKTQGEEFINKAKQLYQDMLQNKKEETIILNTIAPGAPTNCNIRIVAI